MSTKVKGEAIKEGSIPLSALSSEIINKLSNNKYKKLDWYYNDDAGALAAKSPTNKIIINEKEYDLTAETVGIPVNGKEYGFQYYDYRGYHVIAYGSNDSDIDALTNNVFILNEASSAATPDWNAQEGESGYIENRTHYNSENIILQKIDDKDLGDINIKGYDRIHIVYDYKNGETDYIIIDVKNKYIIDSTLENWKNGNVDYYFNDDDLFSLYVDDYDYDVLPNINVIGYITKQLDEKFIPDTVVKTTPQELSDNDKNQALANLGIEEYFRQIKKKCTLHIQYDELSFDSENPNLVTGYGTGLDNLIKDIKSFIANCYYYNEIGQLITEFGKYTCTEIFCNDLSDVDNATFINISFGTSIFSEACFASQCQIRYENDELLLFYFEL